MDKRRRGNHEGATLSATVSRGASANNPKRPLNFNKVLHHLVNGSIYLEPNQRALPNNIDWTREVGATTRRGHRPDTCVEPLGRYLVNGSLSISLSLNHPGVFYFQGRSIGDVSGDLHSGE